MRRGFQRRYQLYYLRNCVHSGKEKCFDFIIIVIHTKADQVAVEIKRTQEG